MKFPLFTVIFSVSAFLLAELRADLCVVLANEQDSQLDELIENAKDGVVVIRSEKDYLIILNEKSEVLRLIRQAAGIEILMQRFVEGDNDALTRIGNVLKKQDQWFVVESDKSLNLKAAIELKPQRGAMAPTYFYFSKVAIDVSSFDGANVGIKEWSYIDRK